MNCGLYRYSLKIPAHVVFKRTENRDFMESSFTLTFSVRGSGEDDNLDDNSASTTVIVRRVADLQVARYVHSVCCELAPV